MLKRVSEIDFGNQFPRILLETMIERGYDERRLCMEIYLMFGNLFTEKSLKNWITGKCIPNLGAVIAIAEILNVQELIRQRVILEKQLLDIKKTAC
jgi:hypothetical protein